MPLPPGFLDDLRSRVSLAQVVGRKVAWDARKSNAGRGDHWAPCPFHQERTASFHVDDRKGFYYCFGCHAKGDALTFVQETEGLGFMESVERLAAEAGMAMPERDPGAARRTAALSGLADVMEAALRFYRAQLGGAQAVAARAYLDGRGVAQGTRERFELGFAGSGRNGLLTHLTGSGVPLGALVEAGLCRKPDDGGTPYDLFRDRILFPIRDARGRAIAFGGRAMSPEARAKYLNSPETPLFDKGRTLYNIGPARAATGRTGALVVVEGYMDVIALAQAGIEHAVAPLGTAITAEQLRLMWRIADEPVIALDGDRAGQSAAGRLADLALPLLTAGKGLRFALMPPKKDPDDVIREGGAHAFEALVAASRPIIDLLWTRETEGAALDSPERRAALDARLRAHLGRIADPSIRAHYQSEFRARSAAMFAAPRGRRPTGAAKGGRFRKDFRNAPRLPAGPALDATRATLLGRADADAIARNRESAILAGCLNHPGLVHRFEERLERAGFVCADLAALRDALLSALGDDAHDLRARIASRLGRDPLPDLLAAGPLRADRNLRADADPELAARAIDEALDRQAAWAGRRAEIAEAERDLAGATDEGVTWRLREAAEAAHAAVARALADVEDESRDESILSQGLQSLLDGQMYRKPEKK